jgi:hypothetical protein
VFADTTGQVRDAGVAAGQGAYDAARQGVDMAQDRAQGECFCARVQGVGGRLGVWKQREEAKKEPLYYRPLRETWRRLSHRRVVREGEETETRINRKMEVNKRKKGDRLLNLPLNLQWQRPALRSVPFSPLHPFPSIHIPTSTEASEAAQGIGSRIKHAIGSLTGNAKVRFYDMRVGDKR